MPSTWKRLMPSSFLYSQLLGVHSFVDLCSGTTHFLHEALPGYFSALLRLVLLLPPLPPALCHFSPSLTSHGTPGAWPALYNIRV